MNSQMISRRRFLAAAGAVAAGWWMLPAKAQDAVSTDANRFILMADTHVCQDRNKEERACKPYDTFVQASAEIRALTPRPAGLLIAGDCVYTQGLSEDYAVLKELLAPIQAAGIPVHMSMGNHDNRANFRAAFPDARPAAQPEGMDRQVSILETPHADWYLLDSLDQTQSTPGRFGEAQLSWLAAELDKRPNKPALMMAHHYPAFCGENGLEDSEAFFRVIDPRPQAKAYFFGHSHHWEHGRLDTGIHMINLPANAWLFKETEPRGWVDAQLTAGGAALTLNCLDRRHPLHGEKALLEWRT